MSKIAPEVWQFCKQQIILYPLYAAQKQDAPVSELQATERYVARCVERMRDAIKGLTEVEIAVIEAIWKWGWESNEVLANKLSISPTSVKRHKRTLIERVAVRWGLWIPI